MTDFVLTTFEPLAGCLNFCCPVFRYVRCFCFSAENIPKIFIFSSFLIHDISSLPYCLFLWLPTHIPRDFFLLSLSPDIFENLSISASASFRSLSCFSSRVMSSAYCSNLRSSFTALSFKMPLNSSLCLIFFGEQFHR